MAYLSPNITDMAIISLESMEFYAHHGHFAEEQIIGTRFIVDLFFETDTRKAERSDQLEDTVNYQAVYTLVKEEMAKKSKLLEHVAWRILARLREVFPEIIYAEVKLCKVNPPLGGQLGMVCVSLDTEDMEG